MVWRDLAIRLEKVFGSTADTWLRMQMQWDRWETDTNLGQ